MTSPAGRPCRRFRRMSPFFSIIPKGKFEFKIFKKTFKEPITGTKLKLIARWLMMSKYHVIVAWSTESARLKIIRATTETSRTVFEARP